MAEVRPRGHHGRASYLEGFSPTLSLVAIPVKAYSAHGEGGPIQLNQLHAECNSRIKYKKTCPVHGEVTQDEIVSGYEYAKGQYVVVDPAELDKLRSEDEKALRLCPLSRQPFELAQIGHKLTG
jgi:non-homologous end joining protein Ku